VVVRLAGSLTTQGLAAAVAPLTRLTTLLPPAQEVSDDSYGNYSDNDISEFFEGGVYGDRRPDE
jgi:hypothetical protein